MNPSSIDDPIASCVSVLVFNFPFSLFQTNTPPRTLQNPNLSQETSYREGNIYDSNKSARPL